MAQMSRSDCEGIPDWQTVAPSHLVERIREAGIAGMGGAGFPTAAVKLNPGATKPIDTLMINGTECEPYITADDTLMQCQADALVEGALILAYVVGAERVVIGIEDNKPAAIAGVTAKRCTVPALTLRWRASRRSIPRVGKSNLSKSSPASRCLRVAFRPTLAWCV